MSNRFNDEKEQQRAAIIGLGDHSGRKSYYPELKRRLTELEETRASLLQTNRQLRAVLDAATEVAIIATDTAGTVTLFNRGAEKLLGATAEAVTGNRNILSFIENAPTSFSSITATSGEARTAEWVVTRGDGARRNVRVTITVVEGERGEPAGYLAVAEDITEKKKARELLSLVIDSMPNPVFYKDAEGRYVDCNRAFCEFLGRKKEDLVGKTVYEVAPSELAAIYHEADLTLMREGGTQVYETKVAHADGKHRDVIFYKAILKGGDAVMHGLVGAILDISERKASEQALRESEEELRLIFETSQAGIILVSGEGRIIKGNPRIAEMFGCSEDELPGLPYAEFIDPAEADTGREKMRQLIEGTIDSVYLERRYRRRNGTEFWGLLSGRRLLNDDGSLRALVGIIADITETKAARDALEQEKERLAVTLRSIGDGVIAVDTEGRVVLLNEVSEQLCGWKNHEAQGRPLREVFRIYNEITRAPVPNPVDKVLESGEVVELANHTVLVSRDGTERPIEDSAAPIRSKDEIVGVVLVFRDMTEKKAIQEELFRTRKLESLGVLAGGIAHDFNNLLTGIVGNISVASMLVDPDSKPRQLLDRAQKGIERAADLTMQLLTFSKGGAPVKQLTSISRIVIDSATFALRGSNVRCDFAIADDVWPVEVDPGQMSQVINNLIINADQAMPHGGTIVVKVENFPDRRKMQHRQIRISITDSGTGIDPEYIHRIFDPYFTTKKEGTGLGLATVHSIVRNHDGEISVTSGPGKGTTFVLTLPAYEGETVAAEQEAGAIETGHGRILIMDDEKDICMMATEALSCLGYEPVDASDGDAAVSAYRAAMAAGTPFDAVLMDLTVPGGTGGIEATRQILEIDPKACVIVSSGYSSDPVIANFGRYGFYDFLIKPYAMNALAKTVAAAAAESRRRR